MNRSHKCPSCGTPLFSAGQCPDCQAASVRDCKIAALIVGVCAAMAGVLLAIAYLLRVVAGKG